MKTRNFYCTLLLLFATTFSFGQDFELNWSDKMTYSNSKSKTGYFDQFIGANDDYVYTLFNNLSYKSNATNKRLDLVAYDKETMRKVGGVKLKNYDNARRMEKLKGKEYLRTIVLDKIVYVFWEEFDNNSNKSTIYAEAYDKGLDMETDLTEVFSVKYPEDVKKKRYARNPIVIISGKNWNNDVLVGTEIHRGEGEEIEFKYIVINSELEEIKSNEVNLGIIQGTKKSAGLSSGYRYGEDGNVYVTSVITVEDETKGKMNAGRYSYYTKLSVLNLEDEQYTSNNIKFENKNVIDFDYTIENGQVRIFGFYADLSKSSKGYKMNGIFSAGLDQKSGEIMNPVFTEFDKKTLDELYKDDNEDRLKGKKRGSEKKKAKSEKENSEAISSNYIIDDVKLMENGNLVIFSSIMYNYTVTVCTSDGNGGTNCYEKPMCDRKNVTAFCIDPEGELVWSKNIDRHKTYSGWNIYDMRVLTRGDKAYVVYGSSFDIDAESDKKKRKNKKSRREARDNFEYAVFDLERGKAEKREFVVNDENTVKQERKYFSPMGISVIDNEYYVSSERITYKIGGCVAGAICWPFAYYVFLSPSMKKGEGYLGKLEIIED